MSPDQSSTLTLWTVSSRPIDQPWPWPGLVKGLSLTPVGDGAATFISAEVEGVTEGLGLCGPHPHSLASLP